MRHYLDGSYKAGKKAGKVILLTAILISLGSNIAPAENGPGFNLKIQFLGSIFVSDEKLVTGFYPAVNDDPELFDAKNQMQYHFDGKLGASFYGALCYKIDKNVELELGLGYTDISMEITERSDYWYLSPTGTNYLWSSYEHDKARDSDFSIMRIRPGANLMLSPGSRIAPYLGARLNVMIVKAKASLVLARPYVAEVEGKDYLFIGEDAYLEELDIEGSRILIGVGLASGLEFKVTRMLSMTVGVAYDLQFKKTFDDFSELIEDSGRRADIENIGYEFEGMDFTNIGFMIGMKLSLWE